MPENTGQPKKVTNKSRAERAKSLAFTVWAIIGILLLVVAVGYVLGQILTVLAIIGFSAVIVFILRVPVTWLERQGVRRSLGTAISYVGGSLVIAIILLIFIPIIWEQTIGFIELIPEYTNRAVAAFNEFYLQYSYLLEDSNIQGIVSSAAADLSSWATDLVSRSTQFLVTFSVGLVTSLIVLLVSLVVGFWILMDMPKIGREIRIMIGPKREEEAMFIVSTISRAFGGYLRGMTICGASIGIVTGIGYYILGLPYPAVLGLLTGLVNFIPYIGPWFAGIVVAIIGMFISPVTAFIAIVLTIVAQQLIDALVYPRVMSSAVDLHPSVVLVGVFTGGAIGGVIGLICAVPLLAAIKSIFVYFFEKRTGRKLEDKKGALFRVRGHKGWLSSSGKKHTEDSDDNDADADNAVADDADADAADADNAAANVAVAPAVDAAAAVATTANTATAPAVDNKKDNREE